MDDQYEARVECEMETSGGDVDNVSTSRISAGALLEIFRAAYPTIDEMIDSVVEIRLTIKVKER